MGNFTLGRYMPLDSPIHKMDPRMKIIAMLIMLVSIFIMPDGSAMVSSLLSWLASS